MPPIKAAQVKGTVSVLKPEFRHFSPALGLIALSAPSFVNNLYGLRSNAPKQVWGLQPTCAFVQETYFTRDPAEEPRPCRNPSKAISHLTPKVLGHILGLAVTRAPEIDIQATLRANGIETNRVNGVWTGVSLARYKRLVSLVRDAYAECKWTPAVPLLCRLAWEKAESKRDLLDFLISLGSHVGTVFDERYADLTDPKSLCAEDFFASQFNHDELCAEERLSEASSILAQTVNASEDQFARSLELVSASTSQSQAFKPAWKILRHSYKEGKRVPDCVEVTMRELIDLLAYDSETDEFDAERLPNTCSKSIINFYRNFHDFTEETSRSFAWFRLCQEIDGCEYISETEGGVIKYELFPSLKNVFFCAAHLLGRPEWGADSRAFVKGYNDYLTSKGIHKRLMISERREMFRAALAEESRRREIATIGFEGAPHYLEVTLEGAHRLATVKHCRRVEGKWIQTTRPQHFQKWKEQGPLTPLLASVFWPAFLQDYALSELQEDDVLKTGEQLIIQAILSARWGMDRSRWSLDKATLTAEVTPNEERLAYRISAALAVKSLKLVTESHIIELKRVAPWLAARFPRNLNVNDLLSAVSSADHLWNDPDVIRAFAENCNENCAKMLSGDLAGLPLWTRLKYHWKRR